MKHTAEVKAYAELNVKGLKIGAEAKYGREWGDEKSIGDASGDKSEASSKLLAPPQHELQEPEQRAKEEKAREAEIKERAREAEMRARAELMRTSQSYNYAVTRK